MNWIEITVHVPPDEADALADYLADFGYQGVSIEHEGILPDRWDDGDVPPPQRVALRAYIPDDDRAPAEKARLIDLLAHQGKTPVFQLINEEDWAEAWKAHYHPLRIGQRIVVRPLWETTEIHPGDIEIILDPGMAFGTGTHPTTQLCLISLEAQMRHGLTVLDLGCGSGILAIAAVRLGASKVLAVDIDPLSVTATQENAQVNNVADRITAQQGSLDTVLTSARRFDLLLANILAKVIVPMCDQGLGQVVRPGGKAIFSGIITDQVDEIKAALVRTGLTPTRVLEDGDWVAIEAYRPDA